MAEYNHKLADVETPFGAAKVEKRRPHGFRETSDVDITEVQEQKTTSNADVMSSTIRGEQTITGAIVVRDPVTNRTLVKIDRTGLHIFNTGGNEISTLDATGVHLYNDYNQLIIDLTTSGLTQYQQDGDTGITVNENGISVYDASGKLIETLTTSGLTQYNTNGNTIVALNTTGLVISENGGRKRVRIGQNSADSSNYGLWATRAGVDVDQALAGVV